MRSALILRSMLMLLAVAVIAEAKECSVFVTSQMRANATRNAETYGWAKAQQQDAIAKARGWVELSDDALWALVPSQELPRDIHTNIEVGCPHCGRAIVSYGNYPWKLDFWHRPWKIKCPNCGEVYPKNDFHAFYKTALDEHGTFRRSLGDRSLLFNSEHPDPADPLHKLYVDDGYGMEDEKGNMHNVIPYYTEFGQWRSIIHKGLRYLSTAYTLTNEPIYAHKAAVLLDRIADVYANMDYLAQRELGFKSTHVVKGKIEDRIWENKLAQRMAYAYDRIYDGIAHDSELVRFCSHQSKAYKLGDKGSVAAICRHIEDHLLLEILKATTDQHILGNTGATQTTVVVAACALDRPKRTEKWLDWLYDPRFGEHGFKDPLPFVLTEGLDRDGMGRECGNYGLILPHSMVEVAKVLDAYPGYTKHNLVAEYPKLKQCFLIEPRLLCLDAAFPPIGDTSTTGAWRRVGRAWLFLDGYKLYGDPRMASYAWHYAEHDRDRLRTMDDIYEKAPTHYTQKIIDVAQSHPFRLNCDHLGRYGQAILQTEKASNGRALWIHYGGEKSHRHRDCLNIGLYAKNIDMLPDLGYPEYTGPWPKRHAWTSHTVSHNTLLVDDTKSRPGGKISLFAVKPPVRLIDVFSRTAYEELDTYRRTAALIDISGDDSYVFDVFRARGGKSHRLSYHGPSSSVSVDGIPLTKQAKGTFAGEDIEFAQFYDGKPGWRYNDSGFMYLYDVSRSVRPVGNMFTVDWKAEDKRGRITAGHEPHLRLHSLSPCDEVALASGDPPQNKVGNPRRLRYLIQSRLGKNVKSQFVTILEPYDRNPFIRQVRRLAVEHDAGTDAVVAVEIRLENGATDIVVSCEEPTPVVVEGGIEFDGRFGMARFVDGKTKLVRMAHARLLKTKDAELTCQTPAYEGQVTKVDASDPNGHRVFLAPPLPKDDQLVGLTIHFDNNIGYDTSYTIKAIGKGWISTGDISVIGGFKDRYDFDSGYEYLVNAGDGYVLPISSELDR